MKLKNKLLPLVGIATIAATAAPIALTSCGSSSDEWLDFVKYRYNPTIDKHVTTTLSQEDAIKAYFGEDGEWVDDEDIENEFYQDFVWSASRQISANISRTVVSGDAEDRQLIEINPLRAGKSETKTGNEVKTNSNLALNSSVNASGSNNGFTSYKAKFNYIKLGQATVQDASYDFYLFPTVSYQIEYEYSYLAQLNNNTEINTVYSGTLTVTDLPITLYYETVSYKGYSFKAWVVESNWELLIDTEGLNTSPTYYGTIPYSYVDEYKEVKTTTLNSRTSVDTINAETVYYSGMFTTQDELYNFLYAENGVDTNCPMFCSYYMLSVAGK